MRSRGLSNSQNMLANNEKFVEIYAALLIEIYVEYIYATGICNANYIND